MSFSVSNRHYHKPGRNMSSTLMTITPGACRYKYIYTADYSTIKQSCHLVSKIISKFFYFFFKRPPKKVWPSIWVINVPWYIIPWYIISRHVIVMTLWKRAYKIKQYGGKSKISVHVRIHQLAESNTWWHFITTIFYWTKTSQINSEPYITYYMV